MANLRLWVEDLAIAWRIASLRLRGQMQYRSSFLMQISGSFIVNVTEIIALLILFGQFDTLGGWDVNEVLFLHALSMITLGLASMVANGVDTVPELIRQGTFDRILIRPMASYIHALVNEVSIRHFGFFLQGVLLGAIAVARMDVDWTVLDALYLLIVILSGTILFSCIYTFGAIICFWTVNSVEVINAFIYGGSDLGQYPIHIFKPWLRNIFLWVVPVGFVTYYPAVVILDKSDPLGLPPVLHYLAPLSALLFAVVTGLCWQFAIRHYRSTGS